MRRQKAISEKEEVQLAKTKAADEKRRAAKKKQELEKKVCMCLCVRLCVGLLVCWCVYGRNKEGGPLNQCCFFEASSNGSSSDVFQRNGARYIHISYMAR